MGSLSVLAEGLFRNLKMGRGVTYQARIDRFDNLMVDVLVTFSVSAVRLANHFCSTAFKAQECLHYI